MRELLKNMEKIRASTIVDIIHSGEKLSLDVKIQTPQKMLCERCGFISSNKLCKACVLLEGLNSGKAKVSVKIADD